MLFRSKKRKKKIKKENSLQARFSRLSIPKDKRCFGEKVSAGIFRCASLTVESAVILPVFFLCMCTMICFMDIYKLQTEKLTQLCEQAREMGMYAYPLGTESDLEVPSVYTYRAQVSFVRLPTLVMTNRVRVHPWTGYHPGEDGESEPETMVYITETGGVYHTSTSCSYVDLSIRQESGTAISSLRNKSGAKYHACDRCADGLEPAGVVYVTNYGTRYHNLASCSGLKRSVRLVKKSEIPDLRQCSRCQGMH